MKRCDTHTRAYRTRTHTAEKGEKKKKEKTCPPVPFKFCGLCFMIALCLPRIREGAALFPFFSLLQERAHPLPLVLTTRAGTRKRVSLDSQKTAEERTRKGREKKKIRRTKRTKENFRKIYTGGPQLSQPPPNTLPRKRTRRQMEKHVKALSPLFPLRLPPRTARTLGSTQLKEELPTLRNRGERRRGASYCSEKQRKQKRRRCGFVSATGEGEARKDSTAERRMRLLVRCGRRTEEQPEPLA